MATATLTSESESTKLGQYVKKHNRRQLKGKPRGLVFDERITLTPQGWLFDRQPVLTPDGKATKMLPEFMGYAVNEYGGVDNLLRFMDIKTEFVLSLS